jgi:hypothetical protein
MLFKFAFLTLVLWLVSCSNIDEDIYSTEKPAKQSSVSLTSSSQLSSSLMISSGMISSSLIISSSSMN